MASLNYLTIQDILWINLQVTKKVHHFNYARLEEAAFYQYAYGESRTLIPQAGRFVTGFVKMHPFDAGNEATAFVACLAFVHVNGYAVNATEDEIASWFDLASRSEANAMAGLEKLAIPDGEANHGSVPDVRNAVKGVLERYPDVVAALAEPAAKTA